MASQWSKVTGVIRQDYKKPSVETVIELLGDILKSKRTEESDDDAEENSMTLRKVALPPNAPMVNLMMPPQRPKRGKHKQDQVQKQITFTPAHAEREELVGTFNNGRSTSLC